MRKLEILGLKKDDKRIEFAIRKSQEFIPVMQEMIDKLIGKYKYCDLFPAEYYKIEQFTDMCLHNKYSRYEIDVFVGKKRIILVVKSSPQNQKKFYKEFKRFWEYNKHRRQNS